MILAEVKIKEREEEGKKKRRDALRPVDREEGKR